MTVECVRQTNVVKERRHVLELVVEGDVVR
jgi:hypothetical protein